MRKVAVIAAILLVAVKRTNGFAPAFPAQSTLALRCKWYHSRSSDCSRLFQARQDADRIEDNLSDIDARVLQAMLQESKKLGLKHTEEDIRKLLERATAKTTRNKDDSELSAYSSQVLEEVLKTLSDTKLWKKVSAQASDNVESVGVWVTNKVEQNVDRLVEQSSKFFHSILPTLTPTQKRTIQPGETLWEPTNSATTEFYNFFAPLDDVAMGGHSASIFDSRRGHWKGAVTDANNGGFIGIESKPSLDWI
jgi:hypothetical protein